MKNNEIKNADVSIFEKSGRCNQESVFWMIQLSCLRRD